jgi:hypothetical protein
MKVVKLLILSMILFSLIGCNKKDDKDDPGPFVDENRCVTNVEGCENYPSSYSCPEAGTCYTTEQYCIESGECDGDSSDTESGGEGNTKNDDENDGDTVESDSNCTMNVAGCENYPSSYSCPEAENCYGTENLCLDSGECDGNGSSTGGDTEDDMEITSNCTNNVEGCPSVSDYSCPDTEFCFGSLAACYDSGECD